MRVHIDSRCNLGCWLVLHICIISYSCNVMLSAGRHVYLSLGFPNTKDRPLS